MMDWLDSDWFLSGVIWGQSAVLFWCGYWLLRSNRLIKRLSDHLDTATRIIEQQQRMLAVRSVPLVSSDMQPVDIDHLSPEMRGVMREALTELLAELRRKEH